jgi:MYXO-CTERM domain-containing protein
LLAASVIATHATSAQAQLPQTLTLVPLSQTLLAATGTSTLSTSVSGAVVSRTLISNSPFAQFTADQGVLVGVSGALTIANQADTYLVSSVGDGGQAAASLAAHWLLGSPAALTQAPAGAVFSTLLSIPSHGPGGAFSNSWAGLSASTTAIDNFVGTGQLTSSVSVRLVDSNIASGSGNGNSNRGVAANEYIAPAADKTGATLAPLVANLNIAYTFLQHANASFGAGSDINTLNLTLNGAPGGAGFSVVALGGDNTTLLDYVKVATCTGDCGRFNLALGSFADLQAGQAASGNVTLNGAAGSFRASYTLTFDDDTSVGAAASWRSNQLTLNLASVSAVPEPNGAAMVLAGLAALVSMSRRRRVRQVGM